MFFFFDFFLFDQCFSFHIEHLFHHILASSACIINKVVWNPWVHSINNLQTDYPLLLVVQNLSFNTEAVLLIAPLKLNLSVSISNNFVSSTDPLLTTS